MADYRTSVSTKPSQANVIRDVRQLAMDELARPARSDHSLEIDRSFPESFADELSRREVFNKHLFRPNTYLHKWWARRCGSMFRAILKQFVPEPARRDYYAPGGLEGKIVLDPMMGGGTTLHEAIRLGANVIGADIDPIPVAQARASLGQAALSDLLTAFERLHADLYDGLGHYFQTECPTCQEKVDFQYALHGRRKTCACGEATQIDQYILRQETDRTVRICPACRRIHSDESDRCAGCAAVGAVREPPLRDGRLITKSQQSCLDCGREYSELSDLPYYARFAPIAIAATCPSPDCGHGLFFRSPGESDLARIENANRSRSKLDFGAVEDFTIADGPKSGDLIKHGVSSYLDLFSSRQLLYLHRAIRALNSPQGGPMVPLGGIEKLNLGMLVSASLEFNSMMCGYKGWYKRRPGAIRHVFALHAYSFPYTALENNPVNPRRSSGNLQLLFRDRIERGRKWASLPTERRVGDNGKTELVKIPGESDGGDEVFSQAELEGGRQRFRLIHGDSRRLPVDSRSIDMVVTDPPYYDSVQYSDLAAFFRVWLTRLLPDEAQWNYDESLSAVAVKSPKSPDGGGGYMDALSAIFAECARVLKPEVGRMVFTFHHWDPSAWAELTIALKSAGFRLTNTYTVYSEHPISVHIRNLNSIKHDSILVLALADDGYSPSPDERRWSPLYEIETSDSETFCRQSAAALGWLLEGAPHWKDGLSSQPNWEDEIRAAWEGLISGKSGQPDDAQIYSVQSDQRLRRIRVERDYRLMVVP